MNRATFRLSYHSYLLFLCALAATMLAPHVATAQISPVDGTGGATTLATGLPNSADNDALASVNPSTGAVTAQFTFELPQARGGSQPALTLEYNSSTAVGFAGWGWTLAVPTITRGGISGVPRFVDDAITSPTTLATDADADDYYIDGQLLVAICTLQGGLLANGPSTTTCVHGSALSGEQLPATLFGAKITGWTYFRTQVDDGARYFLSPNGQTWVQQLKSGRSRLFGQALDNQFESGAEFPNASTIASVQGTPLTVSRWYLTRDADPQENTVYYSWTNNLSILGSTPVVGGINQLYLSDIYDTLQPGTAVAPGNFAHHVHLTWASSLGGGLSTVALPTAVWHTSPWARLATVDVTSATWMSTTRQLVRRYQLNYANRIIVTQPLANITLFGECSTPTLEGADFTLPATLPCAPQRILRTYQYSPDALFDNGPAIMQQVNLPQPDWGPLWTGIPNMGVWPTALVDMNGDAAADLVYGGNYDNGPGPFSFVPGPLPSSTAGASSEFNLGTSPSLHATSVDLAPGAPQLAYGDWLSDGHPDWLWFPFPATGSLFPSWEVYTPQPSSSGYALYGYPDTAYDVSRDVNTSIYPTWTSQNAVDADGDGLTDLALWLDTTSASSPQPQWTSVSTRDRTGTTLPFARQIGNGAFDTAMQPTTNRLNSSDAITTEADVNGDSLIDVLTLYKEPGQANVRVYVHVFLNNGDGTYTDAGDTETLSTTPDFSADPLSSDIVRMGDLNGDNIADLVVMDGTSINFCLTAGNYLLGTIGCYTVTYASLGWPNPNSQLSAAFIADTDGTGIARFTVFYVGDTSNLWNNANGGLYGSFLLAPNGPTSTTKATPRPGLLTDVYAIGGAHTHFTYDAVHDLSMGGNPVPVPVWVATSVTRDNQLTGPVARTDTTNYVYNSPIYDAREKTFVGFQEVTSYNYGATGAPGPKHNIRYLTDACRNDGTGYNVSCTGVADYGYFHAIRGLPWLDETFDAVSGQHLHTKISRYAVERPYGTIGMDMRTPVRIWGKQTDDYDWEPTGSQGQSQVTLNPVVGQSYPSFGAYIPAAGGGDDIQRQYSIDSFGNQQTAVDSGNVAGVDDVITTTKSWQPCGGQDGWTWRPWAVTVADSKSIRTLNYQYNYLGELTYVTTNWSGAAPLSRSNPGGNVAQTPTDAVPLTTTNNVTLKYVTYDAYGNVLTVTTPNGRCTGYGYDPLYSQLLSNTTIYVAGCSASGAGLQTIYQYDRGFGRITEKTEPGPLESSWTYDAFGRTFQVWQPSDSVPNSMPGQGLSSLATTVTYVDDGSTGDLIREIEYETVDGTPGATPVYVDHHMYIDGFGATLAALDAASGLSTGAPWILRDARTYYPNGLVQKVYKPSSWSGASSALAQALLVPATFGGVPAATKQYDALGRTLASSDYNGGLTEFAYHPGTMSVMITDPEQNETAPNLPSSPHASAASYSHSSAWTSVLLDGHGRHVGSDRHYGSGPGGATGDLITKITYQATGEPLVVTESSPSGTVYQRSMTYDSMGHMVTNSEPNTNGGGTGQWIYAYNFNGELVGTSDARGCGENIYHDTFGRPYAEDYSPCRSTQFPYSQPTSDLAGGLTGDGTEVFNDYDPTTGWLTDTYDRGAHTQLAYDGRGRVQSMARWVAVPGDVTQLASRYGSREYTKGFTYFESNRTMTEDTGAFFALPSTTVVPYISYTHFPQGTLQSVSSTLGTIFTNTQVDESGSPKTRVFGDVAATTAQWSYDANERPTGYSVQRVTAGPWITYAHPALPATPSESGTFQQNLAQVSYYYDGVGNPTSSNDAAGPQEWAPGSLPGSYHYAYSDDYRLTGATATYDGFADTYEPPYTASEEASYFPTPYYPSTGSRWASQSFGYDWTGNMTRWTDDAADSPDRSLGTITNGGTGKGPNQLISAVEGATTVGATYDTAGNVTSWSATTSSPKYSTSNAYAYTWDEVGRLASATWQADSKVEVIESFGYTGSGERVLTAYQASNGSVSYNLSVFNTLHIETAVFTPEKTGTYAPGYYSYPWQNQLVYLPGGRIVYDEAGALPSATTGPELHVFFEMSDSLGSTSLVIDQGTSELVERPTYQPYGAVDSDFRPERWGFNRELIRYTAHEDDAEVGLIYFGARYYIPQLARWSSPDPLAIHGIGADPNPYAFVGGAPSAHVDQMGLAVDDPDSETPQTPSVSPCDGCSNISATLGGNDGLPPSTFNAVQGGSVAADLGGAGCAGDDCLPLTDVDTSAPPDFGSTDWSSNPFDQDAHRLPDDMGDVNFTPGEDDATDWGSEPDYTPAESRPYEPGLGDPNYTAWNMIMDAAPFLTMGFGPAIEGIGAIGAGVFDATAAEAAPKATLELARQVANTGGGGWWRTVSVMETAEGQTIVGGGATDLSIAQKELAQQLGLTVAEDAPGLHAEATVLQHAAANGLTPLRGVSTNIICAGSCAPMIQDMGGTVSGRFFTFP